MSKKKRSTFAIRRKEPRAGKRDPYYCPERDLAHIGPGFMQEVGRSFQDGWIEPWFQEFIDKFNLTEDQMADAAGKLARAFNKVISHSDPIQALTEEGFTELSPAMQVAFYCRMGQVALGGIWAGIKDVNQPDDHPPVEIRELLLQVKQKTEQIAETLNADTKPESPR